MRKILLTVAVLGLMAFAAAPVAAAPPLGGVPPVPPIKDTTKPTIIITTPPANATYRLGEPVKALYTCADTGSSGLSCQGTVSNGASINTSTVGRKSFSVTARDRAGNTTVATRTYTVQPLPDNLPDLSVAVAPAGELSSSPTNCRRVTFEVKREWPSNNSAVSHGSIYPYKVYSEIYDGTKNLGGGQVAEGWTSDLGLGTTSGKMSVGFSLPSNVVYPPGDFTNKITVVVDPDNRISETREWNNRGQVYAHCIG